MSENLFIGEGDKRNKYEALLPQVESLVGGESDLIANMANIAAALWQTFGFFWVGFYRVSTASNGERQLLLGPFQGPIACVRIRYGKGVCGTAWEKEKTLVVADVDQFPGHIACNSASRSEIVVPVKQAGKVIAVLDIDSDRLNDFDEIDAFYLEKIVTCLHA